MQMWIASRRSSGSSLTQIEGVWPTQLPCIKLTGGLDSGLSRAGWAGTMRLGGSRPRLTIWWRTVRIWFGVMPPMSAALLFERL